MRHLLHLVLALSGAAFASQVLAGPPEAAFLTPNAVAPETLDQYRGGFVTDTGLAVSLGLERIVTINGNIVDSSRVNFGDLGSLAAGRSTLSADAANQVRLIQNGSTNGSFDLGPSTLGGTVIQNSLNNQLINNATIINASVEGRGLLQSLNFQNTLSNALNSAATGR
jgi:hypothetical protein